MSKFNSILENNLNKTDLLRVRIKYDPANEESDPKKVKDYVGYVLKEDGEGNIVAIVPDMGHEEMMFGADDYEPLGSPCGEQEETLLLKFKQHVINYLLLKGFQQEIGRHMEDIIKSKDVRDIEKLLAGCNCDPSETLNVYRDFVNDVQL